MTTRRKSAADRRAEIVATALTLAGEVGPHKVTTEAIADRIGVTQPAIFRHFPRKDDMWQAVVAWLRAELATRWETAWEQAPADPLPAVVGSHLDFVARLPALPMVLLSPELRRECPAVGAETELLMAAFLETLTKAVRHGQATGRLSPSLPAEEAAQLVLAVVQGTAMRWAVSGHRFNLSERGKQLLDMAVLGLGSSTA